MNISLDGTQIDQCIILSKSLLTLYPGRPHLVTLRGHLLMEKSGRTKTTIIGRLFDAYAYGYFRTLLVEIDAPDAHKSKVLRIGGRNAIVEDVALESAEFEFNFDFTGYRKPESEWITDSYVLHLELGHPDAFRKVLEQLAFDRDLPADATPRSWALQRVLTTRLKRLRTLLPRPEFSSAASSVLLRAPSAEPDLFMFLCEAVWFWLESGPLPTDMVVHVERLLELGLTHLDPNIQLASIISAARYCSHQPDGDVRHLPVLLLSALGRLASKSYLAATTYFDQIYQTCVYVLPTINDDRRHSLLRAIELLNIMPQGTAGLTDWLRQVDDPAKVALALLVLLWRAPWLQEIELIDTSFGRRLQVHGLRAQFEYNRKTASVYVLCSVTPDEDLFSDWMAQAARNGLTSDSPKVVRVAARPTTAGAFEQNIICGGDLIDLIMNDARLEQELESFIR